LTVDFFEVHSCSIGYRFDSARNVKDEVSPAAAAIVEVKNASGIITTQGRKDMSKCLVQLSADFQEGASAFNLDNNIKG
jgi:hypothetical protein